MRRPHLLTSFLFFSLTLWNCSGPEEEARKNLVVKDTLQQNVLDVEQQIKAHRIDSILHWSNRRGMFNGVVLVAEKGKVIYKGALGYGNYREKDSLQLFSAFQLASVSKTFTATAIMLLKQKGLLDYDQKVKELLPDFYYDTITIRHLLNHRSGLSRYEYLADKYTDREKPISNQQMLELFCSPRPRLFFTPGRSFNYLNTNYAVLASVVENVSGKSFSQFLEENIFDPLGMEHTRVFNGTESTFIPHETAGHKGRRRRTVRGINYYLNGVVGDKGIYSTVEDLFLFDRALYGKALLTPETLVEAYTPGTNKVRRDKKYYGFGWRLTQYKDHPLVYHNGWWMGYKSSFCRFVEDETTIIILTNTDRQLEILPKIKSLLYPEGEPPLNEEPF